MAGKRSVVIISAGCPLCGETLARVKELACPSCDVTVLDVNGPGMRERAEALGVRSVPAVIIKGKLASCCAGRGPDHDALIAAGLSQPMEDRP